MNLWNGVVPSITQLLDNEDLDPGDVALISQSGAVGAAILTEAERQGVGTGHFVSSGNEADLEFSDYAAYLIGDDRVGIIGGYIESIRKGAGFIDVSPGGAATGQAPHHAEGRPVGRRCHRRPLAYRRPGRLRRRGTGGLSMPTACCEPRTATSSSTS